MVANLAYPIFDGKRDGTLNKSGAGSPALDNPGNTFLLCCIDPVQTVAVTVNRR
jgi:hypothetical protein